MCSLDFRSLYDANFLEKDCQLLRVRDLYLGKSKKSKSKFSEVKNVLQRTPGLKEEYEKELNASESKEDTEDEACFLIKFLVGVYQAKLTQYVNNGEALKWLQKALTKSKGELDSRRLGVFDELRPTILEPSFFKVLKLLSKNGNACFDAVCINVVFRVLLLRYAQFKSDSSSIAFTEDEKQFYDKMISLENTTTIWLENLIDQVKRNPKTSSSKPIKLPPKDLTAKDLTKDSHIPEDEPSRLHQFSFILRVLQELGCSAQQVNIRVGMVFEGEILVNSRERRYTQTTEVKRGPLSNNRWKVYEFLYPTGDSHTDKDYDADHLDESKRPSANNKRSEDGFNNQEKTKQNKKPHPNRVERSYSKEDWQECLSLLLPSDDNDITSPTSDSDDILPLINSNYTIDALDELFQDNQIDLVGVKRLFHEIAPEKEEEKTSTNTQGEVEENYSPTKRFHGNIANPQW